MKTSKSARAAAVIAGWCVLSSGAPAANSPQAAANASSATLAGLDAARARGVPQGIAVAPDSAGEWTVHGVADSAVRGTDGRVLGRMKDFLVDPVSGRLGAAVISSDTGAAGLAEKLRLVPIAELRGSNQRGEFSLPIDALAWENLPLFDEQRYRAGSIVVSADHWRRVQGVFGAPPRAASPLQPPDAVLQPGASFRSTPVHVAGKEVGMIDGLVINLQRGTASALVRRGDAQFLVALSKLSLPRTADAVATTTLTADDFQRAQSDATALSDLSTPLHEITGASGLSQFSTQGQVGYSTATTADAATTEATDDALIGPDEVLPPTGRVERVPPSTLQAAARAVRDALATPAAVDAPDVEVRVENGRVVLHGTVGSTATKERLEDLARKAAPGVDVASALRVRR